MAHVEGYLRKTPPSGKIQKAKLRYFKLSKTLHAEQSSKKGNLGTYVSNGYALFYWKSEDEMLMKKRPLRILYINSDVTFIQQPNVQRVRGMDMMGMTLNISSEEKNRSFYLYTQNEEEMSQWCDAFSEAVKLQTTTTENIYDDVKPPVQESGEKAESFDKPVDSAFSSEVSVNTSLENEIAEEFRIRGVSEPVSARPAVHEGPWRSNTCPSKTRERKVSVNFTNAGAEVITTRNVKSTTFTRRSDGTTDVNVRYTSDYESE
ncbi:uncharacterized protein LOC130654500 [Hydractinia symbiolongicarpus]|uniref:uncharacterized protein LOC130654500 n=1 Tax=Hydractinia symbiolongicarpus TaxID=13093 RepID=UPI00254C07A5|nr:uncharacterized protein LOC130654500 [Hydractinia symbiolongicarpus]